MIGAANGVDPAVDPSPTAPVAPSFELITLFPEALEQAAAIGVTGRGWQEGRYGLRTWNPRDFTEDNYRRIDDRPYGGGPGMVMMAEPLQRCVQAIREKRAQERSAPLPLVHLSPQGRRFDQAMAREIAAGPGAILLCGRYEAIDQRFLDRFVDEEWSIGDFIVSGGEWPALLMIDAVARLLPGVLNDERSARQDSFEDGLLDCPHYTRPEVLDGERVPAVLMSGDHARIDAWRRQQAVRATANKRPDLLAAALAAGSISRREQDAIGAEDLDDPG